MVESHTSETSKITYISTLLMSMKAHIAVFWHLLCKYWCKLLFWLTNEKQVTMMFHMIFTWIFISTEIVLIVKPSFSSEGSNNVFYWLKPFNLQHKIYYKLSLRIFFLHSTMLELQFLGVGATNYFNEIIRQSGSVKNQAGSKFENEAVIFRLRWDSSAITTIVDSD